jgi:hypothetical protein
MSLIGQHPKERITLAARWLVLILIGWLTYGLVRALWTTIYLGVPLYDWQWYLGVIILLIGLAIRTVWRWPTKLIVFVFAGLIAWIVVGYNGFGQTIELYPGRAAPAPISFWVSQGISQAPEAVLEDIHAAGGRLYLISGQRSLEGENRQALVAELRRLSEYDIEVYLTTNVSDFLSVPVHDEWIALVQETAAFIRDEDLTNVHGIIGDAESPTKTPPDILGLDEGDFFRTVHNFDNLIELMEDKYPDLSLGITANWPQYTDSLDGDSDICILARSPVDPPGNWDYINVMTYSSYYPPSWRAYYVYLVEQAMARRYPARQSSHLIGVVGYKMEPSLLDFDDLVRDARLSRAMGVQEIVVFWLNGALTDFGDDFVRRFTTAVNDVEHDLTVEVPFSRPISMLLYSMAVLDALLDVRSWRGLLLIGWIACSGIIVRYSVRHTGPR